MTLPVLDRAVDADRYEVISGGFDAHLFPSAAIRPDDRVLDIGCGYGRTTVLAARHASAGHVVGNDVVEPVLAQARALARGVATVSFEHGDAQRHPFPEAGFDVVISRFGVMFFADPVAAFANLARALRPGGRLVFVTVGPPEGNDLARVLTSAVSSSGAPTVHSLADPDRIADVLDRAGFADVDVRSVETTIPIAPDAAAAADFVLQWGAFRGVVDDAAVPAARAALTDGFRPFQDSDGVRLRSTAWLVHATRS